MAPHPNFPRSPYEILSPAVRWFPAAEELQTTAYQKLLPPLVANVREEVIGPWLRIDIHFVGYRQPGRPAII
jgi:hypothetical protein